MTSFLSWFHVSSVSAGKVELLISSPPPGVAVLLPHIHRLFIVETWKGINGSSEDDDLMQLWERS